MVNKILLLLLLLALQVVHVWASITMLFAIITDSKRAWRIAVSYDQLGNVLIGGHEDETISSRAQRARLLGKRWGCVLCKLLNHIWPNHCEKSLEVEKALTNSRYKNP
jgi:hypothetical protein